MNAYPLTSSRPPYWAEFCAYIKSAAYAQRVRELESEGLDTSDAQSCADAEWLKAQEKKASK